MTVASEIVYPDSDDEPMAENTRQYRWIEMIKGGLDAHFVDRFDVFVAGDLFWYPVEGRPDIHLAPDAMVVFGRPKGDRGSYMQWREDNIPPQVVFEILSPSNTNSEMAAKRAFYERYGVQEYYQYDPERLTLEGWQRQGQMLRPIPAYQINNWISPLLQIRFELFGDGQELRIYRPDGRPFITMVETEMMFRLADSARRRAEQQLEQERLQAIEQLEQERLQATQQLEQEREQRRQAETARQQAEEALAAEKQRVAELLARLGEGSQGQAQ